MKNQATMHEAWGLISRITRQMQTTTATRPLFLWNKIKECLRLSSRPDFTSCIHDVSIVTWQNTGSRPPMERLFYLGSQFQSIVHHGEEVTAGAWGNWPHYSCSQEAAKSSGAQIAFFSFSLGPWPRVWCCPHWEWVLHFSYPDLQTLTKMCVS